MSKTGGKIGVKAAVLSTTEVESLPLRQRHCEEGESPTKQSQLCENKAVKVVLPTFTNLTYFVIFLMT